ncbi:hypothetical protein MMC30_007043 [Trapelia coarctata]|nr:hypothetical protein [Trapelia coarctata]
MSEEIENASLNVPRAIFTTMVLNGALGFAMMVAVLFCLGDVKTVLNTPTGFPFIQIFYDGTQSHAGASFLAAIVVSLSWAGAIGFTATASRMLWSFARDRGVPFHRFISKVEPRTHVPVIAVAIIATIPALLSLIYIGSSTVFNDVVSLSVSGFYGSYFLPCCLLLWRRVTDQIAEPSDPYPHGPQFAPGSAPAEAGDKVLRMRLVWGPWRVPGMLGTINNAFACVYMMFVVFWSFWPPATPVTPQTMNYSVLVTGGVIIFSIVYYYVYGRRQYLGPLVEEEVRSVRRN